MYRKLISVLFAFAINANAHAGATIIVLGPVDGTWSAGYSINNYGVVVGTSEGAGGSYSTATVWQNGVGTALTEWPAWRSIAWTVNDLGQIGGEYWSDTRQHPCIWHDGTVAFLEGQGVVVALNNNGVAAGYSDDQAVMWVNGKRTYLGSLGGTYSGSSAINDAGMIVGEASNGIDGEAFLWHDGKMIGLGNLGGRSTATGISNSGLIVGASRNKAGYWEAFTHDGKVMTGAGVFGYDSSAFWAVNSYDQVLGFAWNGIDLADTHPFMYDHGDVVFVDQLLPSIDGWTQLQVNDFNDVGQIAGFGVLNGQARGFLITILEPGDVTGDGMVNALDLLAVIDNWGTCPSKLCVGDGNNDGQVNVTDLLIVISNWG